MISLKNSVKVAILSIILLYPIMIYATDTPTESITPTVTESITGTTTSTNVASVTETIQISVTVTPTITSTGTQCIGEGTASINPAQVIGSSTGNTMIIEYTAGSTGWVNGELYFELPLGWSDIGNTTTAAGFTSVTVTSGSLDMVIYNPLDPRHLTIFVTNLQANTGKITITYGDTYYGGPGATAGPCLGSGNTETAKFTLKSKPLGSDPSCEIANSPEVQIPMKAAPCSKVIRHLVPTNPAPCAYPEKYPLF